MDSAPLNHVEATHCSLSPNLATTFYLSFFLDFRTSLVMHCTRVTRAGNGGATWRTLNKSVVCSYM